MKTLIHTLGFMLLAILLAPHTMNAQKTDPNNQPKELGTVSWHRNYGTALAASLKQNKPVLILFQEVPGCATCRNYGHDVLSNPLLTEVIQNEFIPLAIFNNKGGADKRVLSFYKEPTWNNPVVRIVDADGINITDRVAGNYSAQGLYNAMEDALSKTKKEIPNYMQVLKKELYGTINTTKETYFKMYCFWSGEAKLGSQPGVLNTNAGFMDGHEVVKVIYNEDLTSDQQLAAYAQKNSMYPIKKHDSYRNSSKDEDYYLRHSDYRYLPLTTLQRTLINSALGTRKDASIYLSPKQKALLKKANSRSKILFHLPIEDGWDFAFAKAK